MTSLSHASERARRAAGPAAELGYLVYIGLAAVIALGGIDPFESTTLLALLGAGALLAVIHHAWYARHREQIEHDHAHLPARERRGF
jgi:hypothetical protein